MEGGGKGEYVEEGISNFYGVCARFERRFLQRLVSVRMRENMRIGSYSRLVCAK